MPQHPSHRGLVTLTQTAVGRCAARFAWPLSRSPSAPPSSPRGGSIPRVPPPAVEDGVLGVRAGPRVEPGVELGRTSQGPLAFHGAVAPKEFRWSFKSACPRLGRTTWAACESAGSHVVFVKE